MSITYHFSGKRALVTGAGKGIGREICLALRKAGAEVVAVSRTQADLDQLAQEGCDTIQLDVSDYDAVQEKLSAAGPIDLLVNNAGVSFPESFLDTTVKAFEKTLAINVTAAMLVSQIVAKQLIQRGAPGAIVNLSSQASMVGLWDHASYCASKGALDQLTRVMALELGPKGIRVNNVNPTVTLTPMAEMAWSDPEKSSGMLSKIPLGRFAQPSEVVDVVLYLLSEQSAMVHGAMVPVDGGFLAAG